jgi:hypothetical protein
MNDPDNFLSRWSRRKHEAGERKEKKEETAGEVDSNPAPENEPGSVASAPDTASAMKFDADSLPPIESISAKTDITAFMRSSVPETLKHAALRRAWSSDPAVRDFVGLNENFWDAAGPEGIPGFGDLDPNLDVKHLVSELFGEAPRQDASSGSEPGQGTNSSSPPIPNESETANLQQPHLARAESPSQRNENAAAQPEQPESAPEKKFARRHGGAMPQ